MTDEISAGAVLVNSAGPARRQQLRSSAALSGGKKRSVLLPSSAKVRAVRLLYGSQVYLRKLAMTDKSTIILALALLLGTIFPVWAHAFVDHADPAVGSQTHSAPTQVRIWFTEKLEPVLCKVQVFDATGQEVDKRDVKIDRSNTSLLTVSLPDLKPGKYRVTWRAVSLDTHVTTGDFKFEFVGSTTSLTP
jgi:copper resistance protein C